MGNKQLGEIIIEKVQKKSFQHSIMQGPSSHIIGGSDKQNMDCCNIFTSIEYVDVTKHKMSILDIPKTPGIKYVTWIVESGGLQPLLSISQMYISTHF